MEKIVDDLNKVPRELPIALAHGTFDILHPGHVLHLEEAAGQAEILVVTITGDKYITKRGKTFFNEKLRAKALAALECVDYVYILREETAISAIRLLRPDIFVKGKEYAGLHSAETEEEKRAVEEYGGKIHFTSTEEFSSTKVGYLSGLMSMAMEGEPLSEAGQQFADLSPSKFEMSTLHRFLNRADKLKACIIGETIMDEWVSEGTVGYSQDNKCMGGTEKSRSVQYGGAGIVAQHTSQFLLPSFVTNTHEILKTRYMDDKHPLYLHKTIDCPPIDVSKLRFDDYDVVLVADFGHGFIDSQAACHISTRCKSFLAVQAQTNRDNFGFNRVDKYPRANYYNLNRIEAELLIGKQGLDAKELLLKVHGYLAESRHVFISLTDGANGAWLLGDDSGNPTPCDRMVHLPALNKSVVDTIGCGDALFSLTALALALHFPLEESLLLGSLAAAIMTQRQGNAAPVSKEELMQIWKVVT